MIPTIVFAALAVIGLGILAYRLDAKAHREDKPASVAAPRIPAKHRTGTKAKQAYQSMAPSPPRSKQSKRRWLFQRLMASKYAAWRDNRPRRKRREAAWLEAKARTAMR